MIQYPMDFRVSSQGPAGVQTQWTSVSDGGQLTCAIPPEFKGPGGGFSPEDFYAYALANCFIATFKVIAEGSKLSYANIKANGVLTVDRDEKGRPCMAKFHLRVELSGVADAERATRILDKTSQSCIVLNSVNTVKTFEWAMK